jgi:hypothetical protein
MAAAHGGFSYFTAVCFTINFIMVRVGLRDWGALPSCMPLPLLRCRAVLALVLCPPPPPKHTHACRFGGDMALRRPPSAPLCSHPVIWSTAENSAYRGVAPGHGCSGGGKSIPTATTAGSLLLLPSNSPWRLAPHPPPPAGPVTTRAMHRLWCSRLVLGLCAYQAQGGDGLGAWLRCGVA